MRDEVRGKFRVSDNEELRDLYASPRIFCTVKLMRIWWAAIVA